MVAGVIPSKRAFVPRARLRRFLGVQRRKGAIAGDSQDSSSDLGTGLIV